MNSKLLAPVLLSLVVGVGLGYSISLPGIMSLQSSVSELESETSALTSNYNNLNTTYNQLIANYNYLNESYVELSQQYQDLLFHYNLLNKPASNFTTLKELQITLTTHQTTYYYKDPVSGNVTITYLNGTPFEGEFSLSIFVVNGGGVSGILFNIRNGFAEFSYGQIGRASCRERV